MKARPEAEGECNHHENLLHVDAPTCNEGYRNKTRIPNMCHYKCHRRGQRNLSNRRSQDALHIHRNAARLVEAISASHLGRSNMETNAKWSHDRAPMYNKDSKNRRPNKANKAYPPHAVHVLHMDCANPFHCQNQDHILRTGNSNHQAYNF